MRLATAPVRNRGSRPQTPTRPHPSRAAQEAGGYWFRLCLAVLFIFGIFTLLPFKGLGAPESPAGQPSKQRPNLTPEVTDLLSSLGLVEYLTIFHTEKIDTVKTIAAQTEDNPPHGIKIYHWQRILAEARNRVQHVSHRTMLTLMEEEEEENIEKEAPEDKDPLRMAKSRTLGKCHVTRNFLPADKEDDPPIFWSFPGSGNTWIRFLIEQATGIYTGSVYRDLDIIKIMPGELRCDRSVVAVKGHPNWTPFDLVDRAYTEGNRYWINGTDGKKGRPDLEQWHGVAGIPKFPVVRTFDEKCGGIRIHRALVVTRNPFSALWAEYQRVKSERVINGVKEYGHVAKLLEKDFDPLDMRRHLISLMQDWLLQFVGYEGFIERNGCESILFQPFEELVNKVTRDYALQKITSHLRKPMATSPDCAFRLADHPAIRREKVADPAVMNIQKAYEHPLVGNLVCDMYEIAAPELEVLGYETPKLGPTKGVCPPPKRRTPVISKHTILTAGTANCHTDRVPGMSSPDYVLHGDLYDNSSAPKPIEVPEIHDTPPKQKDSDPVMKEEVLGDRFDDVTRPYLTIASTGRNDLHSGNVVDRTQNQLTNIAAYVERYKVFTEVIIVEWNPEPDRKPLSSILVLPNTTSGKYINVRILTVPPRLHEVAVEPPIHMPVQQYIGKNVAVRRARGEFVLCWNADMLLNGAFWERVKRRDFKKGIYYRIDRLDFDKPFPPGFDVGNLEREEEAGWIELHTYQVRSAVGTRTIITPSDKAMFWHDFHNTNDTTDKFAQRCCNAGCSLEFKSCRWKAWRGWTGDRIRAEVQELYKRGDTKAIRDILNIPQQFHANAPGDFLMMSKEDWMRLRGYPEAPYQDEMDKYIMAEAFAAGMDQEIMPPPVASFHQYHPGSWGAAGELTEDMKRRPSLGQQKYIDDGTEMLIRKKPVTLWDDPTQLGCNNPHWGFGNIALQEMWVQPQAINTTRPSMRVVREPFDQIQRAVSPGCGWKYKPKD
eukprot:Sspe_Gene.72395::Locus_43198_Transcript_1_1_Confidence_1.000_Length_3165::g.72395::m.72395